MTENIREDLSLRRIRPEVARRRIEAFFRRFGQPHLSFAQHAAFPLALTPDLAYRLWANFQRNIHGEKLNTPWVAVADLLLSSLCDEVGYELYEMNSVVREILLSDLRTDPNFGPQRIQDLAFFLLKQIERQLESHDPDMRELAQTQQWTALAYVHPGDAARDLAQALRSSLEEKDHPEQLRLASLIETFAEPLGNFIPLLTYARGIGYLARGDTNRAMTQFSNVTISESSVQIQGISLPIPQQIQKRNKTAVPFESPTQIQATSLPFPQQEIDDRSKATPQQTPDVVTDQKMRHQWQPLIKPSFLQDINRLPPRDVRQIIDKITLLTQDPSPDGWMKKQLKYCPGKPYRLRSGDYRIFYTYNEHYINIYKIDRLDQSTYTDCPEAEDVPDGDMGALDIPDEELSTRIPPKLIWEPPAIEQPPVEMEKKSQALPEPISIELLNSLDVPKEYHESLLQIKNEDDLLACQGVDQEILLTLLDRLFPTPLPLVMLQPDLVLNDPDDLRRYYEDPDLVSFLLKNSAEQEKYIRWPLNATGPTLIKGGPGTGKSTLAFYRIRSLLQQLQQKGELAPRILFTTYTNTLIKFSEQLLQQLLGPDASHVHVYTADKLVSDILHYAGQVKEIISGDESRRLIGQAIAEILLEGNMMQQEAQRLTLKKMGHEYLLQEINTIIIARQVNSLEDYLHMPRMGRMMSLSTSQRSIVWRTYERWRNLLQVTDKETWEQRRARAESLIEQTPFFASYDAVVIDEAQDLDPSTLRMLIKLCKASNRLFITADANQTIYNSGFTWADVHQSLKFHGRTNILRVNYRSTHEISKATRSYLSEEIESEVVEPQYVNNGPKPKVLAVQNPAHEAQLLAIFFKSSLRSQRLTMSSCVILCPNESSGKGIVSALKDLNLEATFMTGRDLDLAYPGIKVLTLQASKGLEFPIVALAGFISSVYPVIPHEASDEERTEIMARERRIMFLGMTRAMRHLLVIVPAVNDTVLFQGFDPRYWDLNPEI